MESEEKEDADDLWDRVDEEVAAFKAEHGGEMMKPGGEGDDTFWARVDDENARAAVASALPLEGPSLVAARLGVHGRSLQDDARPELGVHLWQPQAPISPRLDHRVSITLREGEE